MILLVQQYHIYIFFINQTKSLLLFKMYKIFNELNLRNKNQDTYILKFFFCFKNYASFLKIKKL